MYLIKHKGEEREFKAKGVRIEQGSVLLYKDEACSLITAVVPQGKWDVFEVMEGVEPLVSKIVSEEEVKEEEVKEEEIKEE